MGIFTKYKAKVAQIHNKLHEIANEEDKFVGWLNLPTNYDKEEFQRIKRAAKNIQDNSEVFLVIGILRNIVPIV